MSKIFFSASIKGGVGKTTLAALVADAIQLYAPGEPLRCFSPRIIELQQYVDEGIFVKESALNAVDVIGETVESVGDSWGVFDFTPGPDRRVLELAPDIVAAYPHVHFLYNVGNERACIDAIRELSGISDNVTMCYVERELADLPLEQVISSLAEWGGDTLAIPRLARAAGHVEMMNKRSIPQVQRLLIQSWKHRAINAIRDHFNIKPEAKEV